MGPSFAPWLQSLQSLEEGLDWFGSQQCARRNWASWTGGMVPQLLLNWTVDWTSAGNLVWLGLALSTVLSRLAGLVGTVATALWTVDCALGQSVLLVPHSFALDDDCLPVREPIRRRVFLKGNFVKKWNLHPPPHNWGVPRKIISRRRGWSNKSRGSPWTLKVWQKLTRWGNIQST